MITGRPPKPTNLKAIEGNKGKRDISAEAVPQFDSGDPGCPEHLNDRAKAEWTRLAPILVEKGLLSAVDRQAFAMYCMTSTMVDDIEKKIAETPDIELQITKGYINALDKMARQMRNYLQLFGMSPADRMRIKGIEQPKRSKLAEFLGRNPKQA